MLRVQDCYFNYIQPMFFWIREGFQKKKQQNLRHLSKRGGGVRILSKQKFYYKLWQGRGKTLHVINLSSWFFHFSTYFQCFFMVFICISSILVKLSNIWVPFSSNCTDFCSYTFKHLLKKCHNFFKGGRGLNFLYFVTIFYVTITLGVGGVSPNLINVSNFAVFFLEPFP